MAFAYNNALYGSSVNTPLQGYNAPYGARSNAAFSPATSPTDNIVAIAHTPAAGDTVQGQANYGAEELAFAGALEQYMTGANGIQETITAFADTCTHHCRDVRQALTKELPAKTLAEHVASLHQQSAMKSCQSAAACRSEALRFQNRAARHMHLQTEATTLEAEAATWKLLSHLYAHTEKKYPAGFGGRSTAVDTVHHQVARHIANFPSLLHCARVVTWLEELASNSLDHTAEQGQGPRFNETSGVWMNTQAALQSHEQHHDIVTALDPDAPTRQKSSLTPDSTRNEDALNAYLFQLVKAGRVREACCTCLEAGQPWRAAALQGGGPNGPIPLGPAAEQQNSESLTEQLASELEANSHTAVRSLWKWTCFQVAEAAAEDFSGSSELAGQFEAALHAALCGHLQKILPVCQTRADVLWAYTRSWLELQLDSMLNHSQETGLTEGLRVGLDAAHAVKRSNPEQPVRIVMDDLANFWPPTRLKNALPDSFEEVVAVAQRNADGKDAADMTQWQLHQDIIREQFASLLESFEEQVTDQETAQNASQAVLSDKEKADKARMGAHLALALAYLPIDVPGPQDKLSIRPFQDPNAMSDGQDDDSAAAVADAMYQHTREDLKMQESVNSLLQQYVYQLIADEKDDLVPLYCCHMKHDIRRETYAHYFHSLNQRVEASLIAPADCQQAYQKARDWFGQWQRGDIEQQELDIITQQVVADSFWKLQEGPMQWAAALRWLCCSDSTLAEAIREANRLLRQLSLAGHPGIQAAYFLLTEVLAESASLKAALADIGQMEALAAARPDLERDCLELNIWQQFYETEQIYGEFYEKLDSPDAEDEEDHLQELWGLGEQYIQSALQLCQSKDLQNIWERQDHSFLETEPSHELKLWVVPAVDEQCDEAVQEGRRYNVVPPDRMQSFVSGLQTSATACCPQGVTAQVTEAEECKGVAILSLQVNHGQCREFGEDARCLNAIIKGNHPLQAVRMSGPESSVGALAAVAAHPYVLLRAAELRQIMAELATSDTINSVPGHNIIETVAGTESDSTLGLTYYFTQSELQELLESERCTQLSVLAHQHPASPAVV